MSVLYMPSQRDRERAAEHRALKRRLGYPEPVKLDDPLASVKTTTMLAINADATGRSFAKLLLREVQAATAHEFGMSIERLISKSRVANIAHPRMAAMALAIELCHMSRAEVGRRFAGPDGEPLDHTTVINAIKKTKIRVDTDPEFAAHVARIRAALTGPNMPAEPVAWIGA